MQTTFICFSHNLNYALGWMVVHSLWQATAIALLSGVLSIVLRKKTAKLRYWVSNAALVTVLMAAVVTFCIYYDFSKEAGQIVFIPDAESTVNQQLTLVQSGTPAVQSPNYADEGPLSMDGLKAYFNRHIYLIVTIWALGVALFMLRLLGGISYVYYLKSRMNFPADEYWQELLDGLKNRVGVQRGIDLLESALVRSPIVIGHLKPVILFPIGAINRLNPNEVEAILAHELAHVLRNDYVFNIIQSVIEALFYFHPAVWWISAQIRNERENCCDDVAIELCGNSMTYAKSLVSVQEMAYYSPQMAMAFAGQRGKNQLVMRVQRVLNQPQNKVNVREKLIATCLLVALMVGLSFGGNRLDRRDNGLLNTNSNDLIENTDDNSTENTLNTEGSDFLIFVNESGELDSMPVNGNIKDGNYTFSDNTQTVDLKVKDKQVVQFNINGLEVASADIPKFEKMINRIITPPTPPNPPAPPTPQTIQTPEGFYIQSNGNQLNIDNNGLHLDGKDEKGNPIKLSVDANGFVMRGDGVSININDDNDTYEQDAKPGNGIKSYHKNGKLLSVAGDNGVIQNYNEKGELETIIKPNGVIKNYKNKKLMTFNKLDNNAHYNYQYNTDKGSKGGKDAYNTLRLTADNGFSYVSFNLNGSNIWKCYKNGNLLGDLNLINNKPYYNGHEATREELMNFGLLWYNNSLNPLTGGFQIQSNRQNYNQNHKTNDDSDDENNDKDDLQSQIEEFKSDVKELRKEIKECNCTTNFDFRMGLIEELDRLFPAYKSQNQNVFNAFEKRFLSIKDRWEKGECDENKSYSYDFAEQARKNAQKMAEQAKKAAESDRLQAERDRQQAKKDKEQAKRDAETAKRDASRSNYYDGNNDAATKSAIEAELRKDGYLKDGKPLTFIIRQSEIQLNFHDGNKEEFFITGSKFKKYAAIYERVSNKKLFGDSDQRFRFN